MVTQWLKLLIFIKWKWKSLSHVWLFATPWTIQSKILEWVAFAFSRGSSQPSDWMQVSHTAGSFFTSWATGKPKNTGVGSLSLLQWIFPTQELNWGLLHCRQFLNQLSYQGSLLRKTQGLFNFLSFMLNLYPQGDLFSFLGTKISKWSINSPGKSVHYPKNSRNELFQ